MLPGWLLSWHNPHNLAQDDLSLGLSRGQKAGPSLDKTQSGLSLQFSRSHDFEHFVLIDAMWHNATVAVRQSGLSLGSKLDSTHIDVYIIL